MRSRFALLVAASVIFAPGWHGQEPPQHPRGSDLAARVLAPTVDKGTIREAAADVKNQLSGRHANRWHLGITFEVLAAFGLGALAWMTFWLATSSSEPLFGLYRLRFRFSRAPPRLQPA